MGAVSAMFLSAILPLWVGGTSAQSYGPALPAPKGCTLKLNNGYGGIEPKGDPLLLYVSIRVHYLQDVPDSGGSFGVRLR